MAKAFVIADSVHRGMLVSYLRAHRYYHEGENPTAIVIPNIPEIDGVPVFYGADGELFVQAEEARIERERIAEEETDVESKESNQSDTGDGNDNQGSEGDNEPVTD